MPRNSDRSPDVAVLQVLVYAARAGGDIGLTCEMGRKCLWRWADLVVSGRANGRMMCSSQRSCRCRSLCVIEGGTAISYAAMCPWRMRLAQRWRLQGCDFSNKRLNLHTSSWRTLEWSGKRRGTSCQSRHLGQPSHFDRSELIPLIGSGRWYNSVANSVLFATGCLIKKRWAKPY